MSEHVFSSHFSSFVRFGIWCRRCHCRLFARHRLCSFGITKMGRLITWETEHRRTHYAFKWKFVECECVIDDDGAAAVVATASAGWPKKRLDAVTKVYSFTVKVNTCMKCAYAWSEMVSGIFQICIINFFFWYLLTFPHCRALSSMHGNPVNCLLSPSAKRKLLISQRASTHNWLPKLIELNRDRVTVKRQFALNRFHFSTPLNIAPHSTEH